MEKTVSLAITTITFAMYADDSREQISIRNTEITFSIWDLGGQREFVSMLPLVCNDAVAILFMFDLSRKSTLNSIKEWYRQARGFNKVSGSFAATLSTTRRVEHSHRAYFLAYRPPFLSSSAPNTITSAPSRKMSRKRSHDRCAMPPC